ncbi:MAG: hypothetical protein EXQ50_08905 [Acidobacteria bacterium]|nr:hypothetical protein [Acidobacteriota bacterium]MSO62192.1 hypothetical protein [Acidobacteriota bacterium]
MVRSTSFLLVVVMLLASGRLLACGWECSDELAALAAASCHQESAPLTALHGDAAHACLSEMVEPSVTVARPAGALSLAAAPLVTVFVTRDPLTAPRYSIHSFRAPFESPHSPSPSVLRI